MPLTIDRISKSYGSKAVLDNISLELRDGAVSCLLGPSGCGKSTLLDIIAGTTVPDSGSIRGICGRSMAFAFQEPRLLPWRNVAANVDFVLDRALSASERAERVRRSLELVEMSESSDMMPDQLSGGMAQRVSLARALAADADIMLLDEPFSAIDDALKQTIFQRLKSLWSTRGTTVVIVTHNEAEAEAFGAEKLRPFGSISG